MDQSLSTPSSTRTDASFAAASVSRLECRHCRRRHWRPVVMLLNLACIFLLVFLPLAGRAGETENHNLRVLPAPGKVLIDGQVKDWDLTGGIFACGELEHLRDQFAVWFHAMYDSENIYLLARWKDPTPLNNKETVGGHGFNGDCLQVRFIMAPDSPAQTATWWDFWRDAKGTAVAARSSPGKTNGFADNPLENLAQADEAGVKQALAVDADGKGYAQEIAIPWKLLSLDGRVPQVGEAFRCTIEPNFTAGEYGRITIKDLFDERVDKPDRIFTFRAFKHWGIATCLGEGKVAPQPVRIADGRTFKVTMADGLPTIDWTGLIRKFEWPGFKPVTFEMPFDGFASLNIIGADGTIARHLLTWDERSKGPQTVQWDGLSDAVYRTPGQPVPAGEYTWQTLAHPGAKLTFRGFASFGGRVPWHDGPTDTWLGDHGVPSAVVTDGERMFLACNGAEGGRHLLATDFDGNVRWGLQNTTGAGDPEHVAVLNGTVYILHPKRPWARTDIVLSRADAKAGGYTPWEGRKNHILLAADVWAGAAGPDHFDGLAAGAGKLYLSASDPTIFIEDVKDWKTVIAKLKENSPLAQRIMGAIDPECTKRLDPFLAGKVEQEKAFATWLGGPRFDREFTEACQKLLAATDVAPDTAALPAVARAHANRKFLEQFFVPGIAPLQSNLLLVLDARTGKRIGQWPLPLAEALCAVDAQTVYAVCGGTEVVAIHPETGKTRTVVSGLSNACGIATDKDGRLYVSVREPDMQVIAFDAQGKELRRVGRKGGHAQIGPWQADGMFRPAGLAVDVKGRLWVAEGYEHPKRVSVWDLKTGVLVKDFFGPTHYGASGSAINPRDPNLMIGVGCEWRMDPQTGKSVCLGAFARDYQSFATFREGSNGKLYLYTFTGKYGVGGVQVWERLGDARYALRAELRTSGDLRNTPGATELWVDANGDGKEQPEEVEHQDAALFCTGSNGWSLNLGPDLALYPQDAKDKQLKMLAPDGFTAGGAPKYSLARLKTIPAAMSDGYMRGNSSALPSADNSRILVNLQVKNHPAEFLWTCFDLRSGAQLWTYPNPFFQVHGSHKAPAADPGLFRGAYNPIGAVNMKGVGDLWIINGNLGEWYALSTSGFFVTRLFNGNVFEWHWPKDATPGGDLTNLPPGSGGEDFGGSVTQGKDGKVYVQAGKSGIWNLELTGLEKSVVLAGGKLTLTEADTKQALKLREQALQAGAGARKLTVKSGTIAFTGNPAADFRGLQPIEYRKTDDAAVRTWLAHDEATLFVGWEVKDPTPWMNGATDISQMYACGDTVDLQLGTDPAADRKRSQAAKGDIRLSIGNFQGTPTAVLYKFMSADKNPRTFTSGVVQGYQVDYVDVLPQARVQVKTEKSLYKIEAAVPLAALGVPLKPGLLLRGDVGVTHGDPSGTRTRLRTYWANQQTGLVDDVVFELQLSPQNWGEISFE